MSRLPELPILKTSAHFSPFPEKEKSSWLGGNLSITEDGKITGELIEGANSWLKDALCQKESEKFFTTPFPALLCSLQESNTYAFLENIHFQMPTHRFPNMAIGAIGSKAPPFKFSAERGLIFKKEKNNFKITNIKRIIWNLSTYPDWLPPAFKVENSKELNDETYLPKNIQISFPLELRETHKYPSILKGNSCGEVSLEPRFWRDTLIWDDKFTIRSEYLFTLNLDSSKSIKDASLTSWATERFFLTLASSNSLLPYPHIILEDETNGIIIYPRYLPLKTKKVSWCDYNMRGIYLKDNLGIIFQNYLHLVETHPHHYYSLLSDIFFQMPFEVSLLSLASALEDFLWPRKENGKRDEGTKENRKKLREVIDKGLKEVGLELPEAALEAFNKAIRYSRDQLAHGNKLQIDETSLSALNALKVFYHILIFKKIGIPIETIKLSLEHPGFPLRQLARRIHPKCDFGPILFFAKENAKKEINYTNDLLQKSPWKENNLPLPQKIVEYLNALKKIKNSDGNITEDDFPRRPNLLSNLLTIQAHKNKLEETIKKLSESNQKTTSIEINEYKRKMDQFWQTGEANLEDLVWNSPI